MAKVLVGFWYLTRLISCLLFSDEYETENREYFLNPYFFRLLVKSRCQLLPAVLVPGEVIVLITCLCGPFTALPHAKETLGTWCQSSAGIWPDTWRTLPINCTAVGWCAPTSRPLTTDSDLSPYYSLSTRDSGWSAVSCIARVLTWWRLQGFTTTYCILSWWNTCKPLHF